MTLLPTLVDDLIKAGVSPREAARVVMAACEYGMSVRGMSADIVDIRRAKDRLRKRETRANQRKTGKGAEANDAASRPNLSADIADKRTNLSSFLSSIESQEGRGSRGSKKEGSARGARLSADAVLSELDRAFAVANGVSNPDALWAEFVDYWIAVPGQRGVKLNWSSTWRNNVRRVGGTNGARNAKPPERGNILPAAERLAARIADFDRLPERPAICGGEGENPVRLLSKG